MDNQEKESRWLVSRLNREPWGTHHKRGIIVIDEIKVHLVKVLPHILYPVNNILFLKNILLIYFNITLISRHCPPYSSTLLSKILDHEMKTEKQSVGRWEQFSKTNDHLSILSVSDNMHPIFFIPSPLPLQEEKERDVFFNTSSCSFSLFCFLSGQCSFMVGPQSSALDLRHIEIGLQWLSGTPGIQGAWVQSCVTFG